MLAIEDAVPMVLHGPGLRLTSVPARDCSITGGRALFRFPAGCRRTFPVPTVRAAGQIVAPNSRRLRAQLNTVEHKYCSHPVGQVELRP